MFNLGPRLAALSKSNNKNRTMPNNGIKEEGSPNTAKSRITHFIPEDENEYGVQSGGYLASNNLNSDTKGINGELNRFHATEGDINT